MTDLAALAALQAENERLIKLLENHGIAWQSPQQTALVARERESSWLSTADKVALFRRLFRGRTDVYPIRWAGKTSGKSGYAPDCANAWRAGVCEKPRIKCGDCSNRLLIPLSDAVIYDHLAGKHTVGVYPLLEDDSCHFLATDFDEADWREDARDYIQSCSERGVPAAMEISRSGQGAHAWVFFAGRVPARDAFSVSSDGGISRRRRSPFAPPQGCVRVSGRWFALNIAWQSQNETPATDLQTEITQALLSGEVASVFQDYVTLNPAAPPAECVVGCRLEVDL